MRPDPVRSGSAPRHTRAIAGLCQELTATRTVYPGTDLRLVCSATELRSPPTDDVTMSEDLESSSFRSVVHRV